MIMQKQIIKYTTNFDFFNHFSFPTNNIIIDPLIVEISLNIEGILIMIDVGYQG